MWVQYIGKVNVYYKSISLKNIFKKKEKKTINFFMKILAFKKKKKKSLLTST